MTRIGRHDPRVNARSALDLLAGTGAEDPFVLAGEEAAIVTLDQMLQLMTRAMDQGKMSLRDQAVLMLAFNSMNCALASLHLIRRQYVHQALNELRPVEENIQRIELFLKDATWAEFYLTADEDEIRIKMTPEKVRTLVGTRTGDLYWMLCAYSHSRPTALWSLVRERDEQRTFLLGATATEGEMMMTYGLINLTLWYLHGLIAQAFASSLPPTIQEDSSQMVWGALSTFMRDHSLPFSRRHGEDTDWGDMFSGPRPS